LLERKGEKGEKAPREHAGPDAGIPINTAYRHEGTAEMKLDLPT
jgi:hypothetical protein